MVRFPVLDLMLLPKTVFHLKGFTPVGISHLLCKYMNGGFNGGMGHYPPWFIGRNGMPSTKNSTYR